MSIAVDEKPCQDPTCKDGGRLVQNQLKIIYEFHTLFFWLIMICCYLLLLQVELWEGFGVEVGDRAPGPPTAVQA